MRDWWWPGVLLGFTIFLALILLLTWGLLRWGTRQVDELQEEETDERGSPPPQVPT